MACVYLICSICGESWNYSPLHCCPSCGAPNPIVETDEDFSDDSE